MSEWIVQIFEVILPNIAKWMCPEHCTPDFWFRVYVIICGSLVAFTYGIFAYQVHKARKGLMHLLKIPVGESLRNVFIMCLLMHFAHSMAYYHQFWKVVLLSYPILIWQHALLIIKGRKIIEAFTNLRNKKEIEKIEDEKRLLEKELENERRRRAIEEIDDKFDQVGVYFNRAVNFSKMLTEAFLDPNTLNCVIDSEGKMWQVSPKWVELTGKSEEELSKMCFWELMPDESAIEAKFMWENRNEEVDPLNLPPDIANIYHNPTTRKPFYCLWRNTQMKMVNDAFVCYVSHITDESKYKAYRKAWDDWISAQQ